MNLGIKHKVFKAFMLKVFKLSCLKTFVNVALTAELNTFFFSFSV